MQHFKTGRVAIEGGDLQNVYDIQLSYTDGNKTVATGSSDQISGVFTGPQGCELTWSSKISQAGFERDYLGYYRKRKTIQVRLKVANMDIVLAVKLSQPSIKWSSESEIEFSVKGIGKQV
jgi:hypothetical protein